MKTWVCVFALFAIGALSACQSPMPTTPVVPTAALVPATASAWGKLVDDPSGRPLRGVRVALEPWKPCRAKPDVPWATLNQKPWPQHETLICPQPIRTTQTARDGRFTLRAPAGHYLVVIGSDDPEDLTRPTIHDQVWIKGGSQHLLAPTPCPTLYPPGTVPAGARCLPPIPQIAFPKPERDGDYRLATISHWEKPCIRAFDKYRAKWNLDPAVVDEWLTENNRAQIKEIRLPNFQPWPGNGNITQGFAYQPSGDRNCGRTLIEIAGMFQAGIQGSVNYAADPRSHWITALNRPLIEEKPQDVWVSNGQDLRDPRNWKDPIYPTWP